AAPAEESADVRLTLDRAADLHRGDGAGAPAGENPDLLLTDDGEIDQLQIEDDARRIEDAEEANRHVVRPMDREADQRTPRAVERTRESIAQRSDGSSTDLVLEAQALRQHEELASIDAA